MRIIKIIGMIAVICLMLSLTTFDKEGAAPENGTGNGSQEITPPPHTHTPGDAVMENVIVVTCTTDGQYDSVVYCTDCNEELSRTVETVVSNGHVSVETIKENEISATCLSDGSYDSVECCTGCGEVFSRTNVVIEKVDHSPGEAVSENIIYPVCKTAGSRDSVVRCLWCGTELSRNKEVVPATGHIWSGSKCGICGIAYSVAESLDLVLSESGDYYIVNGIGTCPETELYFPSEYKGLPIKEIANYAFQDCTQITFVSIPKSITRLGYGAAMGCTGIKKFVFEDVFNWELMDGQDDTEGMAIPFFMLYDTSMYLDKLVEGDSFWLVKTS